MASFVSPSIHTLQGQSSSTFSPPPLDGSLTVPELFEYNSVHNASHPIFVHADAHIGRKFLLYSDIWPMIVKASALVKDHYVRLQPYYEAQTNRDRLRGPTIGILASADTITGFCLLVATMRLGLVPFPISIRNTPGAVAHLIKAMNVMQLFVSDDNMIQRLHMDTVELLKSEGYVLEVIPIFKYGDIGGTFVTNMTAAEGESTFPRLCLDEIACVCHSSGSTASPKPIIITHRTFLQYTLIPSFGDVDLCGMVIGVHVVPLFHSMGLANVTWPSASGMIMAVFPPCSPPVIPTSENYLEGLRATRSDILFCVPYFVEQLFRIPEAIPVLNSLRAIIYAGAPLNRDIGNRLTKMGVSLFPSYGTTEIGTFNKLIPSHHPNVDEWEYFEISPHLEALMISHDDIPGLFEAAVIHTQHFGPNAVNWKLSDGRQAYRTNDLLEQHPTRKNLFKVYGRADDQITLVTGEKINPDFLEALIAHDKRISGAVFFGTGHSHIGVVVEPAPAVAIDITDDNQLHTFCQTLKPAIELVNKVTPTHATLVIEMVLVSTPSKPFEYTLKGTPKRSRILQMYSDEIEALYRNSSQAWRRTMEVPMTWTRASALKFVHSVVANVLNTRMVKDDDDIFDIGCDSFQATRITNIVVQALQKTQAGIPTHRIPRNILYNYSTVASLTSFTMDLLYGEVADDDNRMEARTEQMREAVDGASRNLPSHIPNAARSPSILGEVVLITGTTGRLGCHVLSQLMENPFITSIYALNRGDAESMLRRQKDAMQVCGLRPRSSWDKVILLSAALEEPTMGLSTDMYTEIKTHITSIIHIAWRVNFNVNFKSFEPLIAGVRSLICLALSSTRKTIPRVIFTSSISVLSNCDSDIVPEELFEDALVATGTGYSESKWVAERILRRAHDERGVTIRLVRVGQLCGDSVSGRWKESEWIPAMVRSSQELGVVPDLNEVISWIPVDVAAAVMIDIAMSDCKNEVFHLVHPSPISWSIFRTVVSDVLGADPVPYTEWLDRLQSAGSTSFQNPDILSRIPAILLLDFFTKYRQSSTISTEVTESVSPTIRRAESLGKADIERWITFWRAKGFLD